MAHDPRDPRSLIELWPSAEVYARDVGMKYPSYARVIKVRNSLPRKWWDATVLSASRRGIDGVTHGLLERLHAPETARPGLDADLPKTASAHA